MSKISETISLFQGSYEWGRRDCLVVATALIEMSLGPNTAPDCSAWHRMPEAKAFVEAKRKHGGVGQAYAAALAKVPGIKRYTISEASIEPGDIVQLGGVVKVMGGEFDTEKRGHVIAVVDDSYDLLYFTPMGLRPISSMPCVYAIWRCAKQV